MTEPTRAILSGVVLGLAFSPIAAAIGSALAAGLHRFYASRVGGQVVALVVLFVAWLVGDGQRMFVHAQALSASGASAWSWTGTVLWGVISLAVGYVLPFWTGTYVGRHVTHGTGWLSATCIGGLSALVLSRIAGTI